MALRKVTLDKWFSLFIRVRDANDQGYVRCCTSGVWKHWKDMDAGHFIGRNCLSTRWDEKNVHAQSRKDNRFLSGKQFEHGRYIDKRYGKGTSDKILVKSKTMSKITQWEIDILAKHYRKEYQRIKKEKGL